MKYFIFFVLFFSLCAQACKDEIVVYHASGDIDDLPNSLSHEVTKNKSEEYARLGKTIYISRLCEERFYSTQQHAKDGKTNVRYLKGPDGITAKLKTKITIKKSD